MRSQCPVRQTGCVPAAGAARPGPGSTHNVRYPVSIHEQAGVIRSRHCRQRASLSQPRLRAYRCGQTENRLTGRGSDSTVRSSWLSQRYQNERRLIPS